MKMPKSAGTKTFHTALFSKLSRVLIYTKTMHLLLTGRCMQRGWKNWKNPPKIDKSLLREDKDEKGGIET